LAANSLFTDAVWAQPVFAEAGLHECANSHNLLYDGTIQNAFCSGLKAQGLFSIN
jgi:hypothetical protein